MRPLHKRKLIAGLVSAAGAAVLALGSLTAGASAAPNPDEAQATNVPYVAWVGEHVRLVICNNEVTEDALKAGVNIHSGQDLYGFYNANFAVEDWSGYQFQPPTPDGDAASQIGQYFDPGPAAFFYTEGKVCIATDYKSLNPGLTRIRLVVKSDSTGEVVFSHQFLVIWLTANKPVLNEAGTSASGTETFQSQLYGSGPGNLYNFLGDKAGDGKFIPSPFSGEETDKGLVQIKVTGSFPVISGVPLSNVLSEPTYTLPEAWPKLAETLASSSEETEPPGTNSGLWDIHGTPSNGTTSNSSSSSALFDTFTRPGLGYSYTSGETATVGPYDPQSANETLLSDGTLNADDAPMPALRIDVSLAPHTGGLSGVGEISGASKAQIYSHDFTGAPNEGNLYNPYYGAYIPATDRGLPQSSGVTGPSPGGDFPGFLNTHPDPYTFWTSVKNANYRGDSHSTGCLRREGAQPSEYETPSYAPQTETFYTDERGEVYVTYTPGDGFYLENLPELHEGEEEKAGEIIKNGDGGCDLKLLKGQEIGNSVISARAVYPYEPVDYQAQNAENTLTKTVTSDWEKEWFQFSKGPGNNENTVKIVVAKAQDIDGQPFVDEAVCFVTPNGGTVSHFPGNTVNDVNGVLGSDEVGPSTIVHPAGKEGKLCETTNSHGLAAIEVTNSTLKKVNLNVEYVEENIIRDHEVNFETPAEEKAEKEAAEKKAHEEEAAAEKKVHEEEAANNKQREEAEAAEKAKLAEEVSKNEKTAEEAKTKEEALKKANEEAAAAEKTANEEKLAAEKKVHEEEVAKLVKTAVVTSSTTSTTSTTSSTTSGATPLLTPAPALSLGTVSGATSLTEAQKLAKALKACKKLPKSKRAACAAKAKKAYSAKVKKHKK